MRRMRNLQQPLDMPTDQLTLSFLPRYKKTIGSAPLYGSVTGTLLIRSDSDKEFLSPSEIADLSDLYGEVSAMRIR